MSYEYLKLPEDLTDDNFMLVKGSAPSRNKHLPEPMMNKFWDVIGPC